MAEALDISNAIADTVASVTDPLVGSQYQIPEEIDADTFGAIRVVPSILVQVGRPLQQEIETRLGQGKIQITIEADIHDGPVVQFSNEGRRQDFFAADPLKISATSNGAGVWTFSGSVYPDNVIGVQCNPLGGASYQITGKESNIQIAVYQLSQACVAVGIPAFADGYTLTVPVGAIVTCASTQTWVQPVSRRRRKFGIFYWCTNPWDRQYLVRNLESLYQAGNKFPMADGSTVIVSDFLGTAQEDPEGNAAQRDGIFLARSQWLMDFTVTRFVRKVPVVAAYSSLDAIPLRDPSVPLLASQL